MSIIEVAKSRFRRKNPAGARPRPYRVRDLRTRRVHSSPEQLRKIDAYWRAANYLSVGQIYLYDNPLLREPLKLDARETTAAGALGHDARTELHLRASEPGHQDSTTST